MHCNSIQLQSWFFAGIFKGGKYWGGAKFVIYGAGTNECAENKK